jgi:hypothetical protein
MSRIAVIGVVLVALVCQAAEEPALPNGGPPPVDPAALEACKRTRSEQAMVECIEKGLYDPCDFGGGPSSWTLAQCAWGHAEVAERKLRKIEVRIADLLNGPRHEKTLRDFRLAQRIWRQSTDRYCRFTNDADASGVFGADSQYLSYGFCVRRQKEQRVNELMPYVAGKTPP